MDQQHQSDTVAAYAALDGGSYDAAYAASRNASYGRQNKNRGNSNVAVNGLLMLTGAGEALATGKGLWTAGAALFTKGAAVHVNEGIYDVVTATGERYVGQSGNISERLAQHVAKGKFTASEAAAATRTQVLGGKTAREIVEQTVIDSYRKTGTKLLNIRNPIGAKRIGLMGPGYFRP